MIALPLSGTLKLIEELGELQAALAKLLDLEAELNSGQPMSKSRRKRLRSRVKRFQKLTTQEMVDVKAAMKGVIKHSDIDLKAKRRRQKEKRIAKIITEGEVFSTAREVA